MCALAAISCAVYAEECLIDKYFTLFLSRKSFKVCNGIITSFKNYKCKIVSLLYN